MNYDKDFLNLKNYLTLLGKPRPTKYCSICGEGILNDNAKLNRHCNRQHKDKSNGQILNKGWLNYGSFPSECKFLNFDEYLFDSKTIKVLDPSYHVNKADHQQSFHRETNQKSIIIPLEYLLVINELLIWIQILHSLYKHT